MKKATLAAAVILAGATMLAGPLQAQAASTVQTGRAKAIPTAKIVTVNMATLEEYLKECLRGNGKVFLLPCQPGDFEDILGKPCQPGTETPENTPETEQPENKPENQPDIEQPDTNEPGTEAPGTNEPETEPERPGTEQPDTPETETPGINTPETEQPGTNQPDAEVPGTNTPENTPDAEQPDTDDTNQSVHAYVSRIVELVNEERAKAGVSPLTLDETVTAAAQVRAVECETSFSHTRPNGTSFATALQEAGVSYRGAGENIAWGQKTPEEVMQGWMNSDGHRANILNAKYTTIGVGYYQNAAGVNYWSQLFTL